MGKSTNTKLRTEYRSLFGYGCEVCPYLSIDERREVRAIGAGSHIEIHHICRMGGRHDYWGNLIGTCSGVHAWGHNGMEHNEDRLKILCIFSKFEKSRMEKSELKEPGLAIAICNGARSGTATMSSNGWLNSPGRPARSEPSAVHRPVMLRITWRSHSRRIWSVNS